MKFKLCSYIATTVIPQCLTSLTEQLSDSYLYEIWFTGADQMAFTLDMDNSDNVGICVHTLRVLLHHVSCFYSTRYFPV